MLEDLISFIQVRIIHSHNSNGNWFPTIKFIKFKSAENSEHNNEKEEEKKGLHFESNEGLGPTRLLRCSAGQ